MSIIQRIKEEPVAFQALIQAILAAIVGFDVIPNLTQGRASLILGITAAVLAFFTRQAVTPNANPKAGDGTALVPVAKPG